MLRAAIWGNFFRRKRVLPKIPLLLVLEPSSCIVSVIVTMGGRGSVLATRTEPEPVLIPTDAVDRVVDTTGAGDAFVGALAFYLCHFPDLKLSEMIRRSGSIATISVQGEGTQTSFPVKKDFPLSFLLSS